MSETAAARPPEAAEGDPETPPGTAGERQATPDAGHPLRYHSWDRREYLIPARAVGQDPGTRNGLPASGGYDPARAGRLAMPPGPPGDCTDHYAASGLCECGYPPGSPSCLATGRGHRP